MTAQAIAATEAESDSGRRNPSRLETLMVEVMRCRSIVLVGNMAVGFPAAHPLA
ncbi:hypothetical protein [Pelomicrobium sp.]|jgi:site-specific recombinase|uniref:hypothetical protein n=1 Tax=Pelomicrobium sp. TaxID=2815319 RepID=UPI002FDDACFC